MDKRNKLYSSIFVILFIITVVSGVTLAIFTWQSISEEDSIIEGESTCFDIVYAKGNNIGSNEESAKLSLGTSYMDGLSTTLSINVDPKCMDITGLATLYLNTDEETNDILINNNILNYNVIVSGESVSSGIINTRESIVILDNFEINYDIKNVTVYVWVNGEKVTSDNVFDVVNSTYKGNITARAESR